MPKETHRLSTKPGSSKQHESQRVKTEKVVEDKRSKKVSEESTTHKSKSLASEERVLKRTEMVIPDSKKVAITNESRVETKKSGKHVSGDSGGHTSRAAEMPLSDFDENDTPKRSSKHAAVKPVTPEEVADDYTYEDDFEADYQDDFEDEFEDEEKPAKPATTPSQPKRPSPQPEPVSKRVSSDSNDSERRERERKAKSSEISYDDDDDNNYKRERKQKHSELTVPNNNYDSDSRRERKQKYTDNVQTPSPKSQPSAGLNFKAAIARTSKLSRRANDLLRLVTFDVTRVDFFDNPVVSEYDLYILNYGKANRKQTATQTFDDAISKDTQTEKVDFTSKWTQNPPTEDDEHSGGDTFHAENSSYKEISRKKSNAISDKSESLIEFMKDAGSAIIRVLDDLASRQGNGHKWKTMGDRKRMETKFGATFGSKTGSFSQANVFTDDHYALERIYFPTNSSAYVISLHGPKEGDVSFAQPHKIAVWNTATLQSGAKPSPKVVITSGVRVTCISLESALTPELLFAGHIDGSLAVWDFRAAFNNNAASFRSSGVVATSSAVFTANDTHLSPLKCLLPLPLSAGSSLTESQAGLRCELLSLDESGLLATWAVADLGAAGNRTMNDDPAVTPGGRIRLLRSSFGNITSTLSPTDGLLEPTCIISHPTSPSRVLIGMSSGDTWHVARYGGRGGGLGSAHPSIFSRKFVSPVLNLAHFITGGTNDNVASNEIQGAFIAATAIGFSVYVTSRSNPVLTFEAPNPANFLHVFPIPITCASAVLGASSNQGCLATVSVLTSEPKILIYQIGPAFSSQWTGASAEIPAPSPSGLAARSGGVASILSIQMCADTTTFDMDDAENASSTSHRYLSAVAYGSGSVDLFLSELVDDIAYSATTGTISPTTPPQKASRSSTMSPNNQSAPISLIEYLLNLV